MGDVRDRWGFPAQCPDPVASSRHRSGSCCGRPLRALAAAGVAHAGVPCLAEHGVHLALLSADAWPPEELRAAQEACGVQMSPVRPDFQRWLICLADNGAEAAGGLGPWDQAVPLEVARQAVMACEAQAAGSDPRSSASPGSPWEPYERCQHERGPRNYPGTVLAADLRRVAQSCALLWPQPAPQPRTPWRACLAEHGLKSPYAPAASELEAAAEALDACAAIEERPSYG